MCGFLWGVYVWDFVGCMCAFLWGVCVRFCGGVCVGF
jgi:hypothetical protein